MTRIAAAVALALAATACSPDDTGGPSSEAPPAPSTVVDAAPSTTSPATTSTTTTTPPLPVRGVVRTPTGEPLPGAVATAAGGAAAVVGPSGLFVLERATGPITVTRPGWEPAEAEPRPGDLIEVTLEPRTVRAIRVSRFDAVDPAEYQALLDLVDGTAVNALVFDTKDETGTVLYETSVAYADEINAVRPIYDPAAYLQQAHDAGLYAITRIVTFEDEVWSRAASDTKLAGYWMDARDDVNWDYPLALAVEACELGFDEVQFDYVRFPAGQTAEVARRRSPSTEEERTDAIRAFLEQAVERLHPQGCAVSAAIFGIVMSSPDDQGIGQRPDVLSGVVDAISPMLYPSHYSPGWLGFADPNDHPGPVIADALDDGAVRVDPPTVIRPWLQAFYYTPDQILAEIAEAENRGMGWLLWNAASNYDREALPEP